MNINISEKELEDYICENKMLEQYGIKIVGRQVSSFKVNGVQYDLGGVVDLIGYHPKSKCWFIIELKKGVVGADAYTQLSRYVRFATDADHDLFISRCHKSNLYPHPRVHRRIHGLLIGSDTCSSLDSFCDFLWDLCSPVEDRGDGVVQDVCFDTQINRTYLLSYSAEINVKL